MLGDGTPVRALHGKYRKPYIVEKKTAVIRLRNV